MCDFENIQKYKRKKKESGCLTFFEGEIIWM